jgi:hypothetical protein
VGLAARSNAAWLASPAAALPTLLLLPSQRFVHTSQTTLHEVIEFSFADHGSSMQHASSATPEQPTRHLDLLQLPQPWLQSLLARGDMCARDRQALMGTCRAICALVLGLSPKCELHMQVRRLRRLLLLCGAGGGVGKWLLGCASCTCAQVVCGAGEVHVWRMALQHAPPAGLQVLIDCMERGDKYV